MKYLGCLRKLKAQVWTPNGESGGLLDMRDGRDFEKYKPVYLTPSVPNAPAK